MCEACPPTAVAARAPSRHKLWDIESSWHCMIIGTCLSMAELRSMAGKFGVKCESPSDYHVHAAMVWLASRERRIGKALNKLLDRKHGAMVARFARLSQPADLAAAWAEALERGDVAGALWAIMSHPAVTDDLKSTVFGEVHMLSHQVGAVSRADLKRLHLLRKERDELQTALARQQEILREGFASRDAALRDLRAQLDQERMEARRLSHAATAAAELDGLRSLTAELQRHLDLAEARRQAAESAIRDLERQLEEAREEARARRAEAEDAQAELAQLERAAATLAGGCDAACVGRPNLCGRCILYVGGRGTQVQHLRRLVEECNGQFVHHDGGFEESMGRLSGLMGRADAVLFPVDCVSHMAHDQLKRLCKRWEKPFVPVRRSGLGAFMRALAQVGEGSYDPSISPMADCR